MLVRLLPGASRDVVLTTLREVGTAARNLQSAGGTHQDLYNRYSTWVRNSVRTLRHMISAADLERLLLTQRYWVLQTMGGAEVLVSVRYLLDTEIEERIASFDETEAWLKEELGRWSGPGHLVVADTTVYNEHPQKLEELEIDKIIEADGQLVHLILPMAVIDELDSLKRGKERWRPGYTLGVLDRVLEDPTKVATLRESVDGCSGTLTIEIAFDPPDHTRLPIMDEEIIDRTLAIQEVAGRELTLITYDTSQSMRARARGLRTIKLRDPEWEKEEKAPSRRAQRRARTSDES